MVPIFDYLTIILSLFIVHKAYINNNRKLINIMILILVDVFYVVPLFLDCCYLLPDYYNEPVFELVCQDNITRLIYDILIIIVQLFVSRIKYNEEKYHTLSDSGFVINKTLGILLFIGCIFAPIINVLTQPFALGKMTIFMWRENRLFITNAAYSLVDKFSYVGVCCCLLILFSKKNKAASIINVLTSIILYFNICLEGKRSITFFLLLSLLLFINFKPEDGKRKINLKKLLVPTLLVFSVYVILTMSLQIKSERTNTQMVLSDIYTGLRVDVFRDDRVRLAIYSILHPNEVRMLDYPLQTLIPSVFYVFPISQINSYLLHIPVAPAYSNFITAALLGQKVNEEITYMTPSIFAEFLSNISFFGIFLFLWLCKFFSIRTVRYDYPYNVVAMIIFVLIQMYGLNYIMYVIELLAIILYVYSKNARRG